MATGRTWIGRAAAVIASAVVAAALVVATPVRRVLTSQASSSARDSERELAWFRRAWASLSLRRAKQLPTSAPAGNDAREMPWDAYQNHPGYGVTVERVVSVFGQAEGGWPREQCDLFDDLIEGDGHLRSLFEQRSQAVAGKPYVIQAGGGSDEDKLAARVLEAAMRKLPLIPFFEHQLSCNRYGWGATEIDWGLLEFEGRTWAVPIGFTNVPARRFRIDPHSNTLRLLTAEHPSVGEELRAGKWIITQRPGPLARAALMRTATWTTCYKRFGTRDWVIYSHKFGLPLVLVSYEDGGPPAGNATDDPTRIVLQEIVRNVGSDGGAVVPDGVKVEIKEADRSGDASKTHGALIAYCNSENSKLVNGSTLANDNAGSGGASYALGEVHASVRWDNVQYDAALLEESVRTQIAAAFVHFNRMGAAAPLLKMQVVRDLTPMVRAKVTSIYVNELGGEASRTQLSEELGYRAPLDASDRLPGKPAPAPAGGGGGDAADDEDQMKEAA
jgi:phage gp29-like protein